MWIHRIRKFMTAFVGMRVRPFRRNAAATNEGRCPCCRKPYLQSFSKTEAVLGVGKIRPVESRHFEFRAPPLECCASSGVRWTRKEFRRAALSLRTLSGNRDLQQDVFLMPIRGHIHVNPGAARP